jgi:hypothetical protein
MRRPASLVGDRIEPNRAQPTRGIEPTTSRRSMRAGGHAQIRSGALNQRAAKDVALGRPDATGARRDPQAGQDGARLWLVGPEPPEVIVIVRVDVRPSSPNPMFLALPNVLLVFRLDRSPDERW